ncbi:MAG: radical SAM protein [Theionarchaea archaeon]|nr:radical SAM protein [Theionarchaea archaeon]
MKVRNTMKIALIQPEVPQSEDEDLLGVYPPIGLAWLAGNIKEQAQIVDLRVTPLEIDNWDVVGISCQTVSFTNCKTLAETLRDELDEAVIVTGGHHLIPEELLTFSDYVVRGEGEITFKELLSCIEGIPMSPILGVTSHGGSNPDRPPADVTLLDPPDYDIIPLEKYCPNEGAMVTSRGCPYHCVFCTSPFGAVWRGRTPSQVVAEAEILLGKGAQTLHIMDDLFTYERERVLQICEGFHSLSVAWDLPNGTRVDAVDQEMLTTMAESGCTKILYGIESGVQDVLNKIRKHVTLAQIEKAVSMTKNAGIEVEGLFMVGNPGDTPKTIKKTVEFAKNLDIKGHFSLATPYPGTDFYTWVKTYGTFLDVPYEDFEQVPVFETFDFSAEDRLQMLQWASAECK